MQNDQQKADKVFARNLAKELRKSDRADRGGKRSAIYKSDKELIQRYAREQQEQQDLQNAQPAWKTAPQAVPPETRGITIAGQGFEGFGNDWSQRKSFTPQNHPVIPFVPAQGATPRRELSTVASAGAAVNVAYGTVNGYAATAMTNSAAQPPYSVTLAVANTQIIVANLTFSYAATYGIWSMTSWTIAVATALPAATATNAYIPLTGPISVSAGAVTNIAGGDGGSKWYQRCGNDTTYTDEYWLVTA